MPFNRVNGALWNFGGVKLQLISLGVTTWKLLGSWPCLALCLRIPFHGSPLRERPLISNFANKASHWALGSMIPNPPLGRVTNFHLTLDLIF